MKRRNWIMKVAMFVPLILLCVAAFVFVTMWLWNWLVPDLFHGPVITFWQAFGLLILSKIIFSGFGKKHGGPRGHWRPYWKDKWNAMSSEDRERFKQKMKDKWCGWNEGNSSLQQEKPNA